MVKKTKRAKGAKKAEITDLDRLQTFLIIVEMMVRHHPNKNEFYMPLRKLLSPLQDEFDMEQTFNTLRKETQGNVEAKINTLDILDKDGMVLGLNHKRVFVRIRDRKKFMKDFKRLELKREPEKESVIRILEIIETDYDNILRVYINKDYSNPISVNKNKKSWSYLLRIMKEKSIDLSEKEADGLESFINENASNKLYTRSTCTISRILKRDGGTVSAAIPIKPITSKAVTQRTT